MVRTVHAYPITNQTTTLLNLPKGAVIHGVQALDATHGQVLVTINPDGTAPTASTPIYQYALDAPIPAAVFPHLRYMGTILYSGSGTYVSVWQHD